MELPSGWTKSKFSELAVLQRGKFSARPRNDPTFYGGEMPFVQTGDVRAAHVTLNKFSQTLNERGIAVSKVFPKGSLLFTIAANIGDVAFLGMDAACPDSLVAILPHDHVDPRWLLHQVEAYQPKFEAAATQNAQLNINLDKLNPFELPCPPLAEQQAIAEALSDADGVVEGLERLIEKKRRIKQGAMQDLLTAKRRLPGFSGDWIERKLGSVATLQRGFDLPNSIRQDGDYPVVYSNGIMATHKHFMCEGPGVVTGRSGTIGNVTFVGSSYWPHNTALWVKNFFGNDPKFIFYLLQFFDLSRFASGSGVPTLNRNDAHEDQVLIPLTVDEQIEIRKLLDDMGSEITALETRLQKARAIKEGMMQNLLTGRVRLV